MVIFCMLGMLLGKIQDGGEFGGVGGLVGNGKKGKSIKNFLLFDYKEFNRNSNYL